jgi:hypothetical protein
LRGLARQDYLRAYPKEAVDRGNRDMQLKNIENVVAVQSNGSRKTVEIARANDILELQRWLMEGKDSRGGGKEQGLKGNGRATSNRSNIDFRLFM